MKTKTKEIVIDSLEFKECSEKEIKLLSYRNLRTS